MCVVCMGGDVQGDRGQDSGLFLKYGYAGVASTFGIKKLKPAKQFINTNLHNLFLKQVMG